jgi:polar amino acid transport system permease protein
MAVQDATTTSTRPPAPPRTWTTARILGNGLTGLWIALGAFLLWSLTADFDSGTFGRYGPRMLQGFWLTVKIVVISVALGSMLALPVALARMSSNPLLKVPSIAFIEFFRGTPLLAQLFLAYYGAGQMRAELESIGLWWFFRDAFNCCMLSFTLNSAAYQAEILRGAISAVPTGQSEAAHSMGLSRTVTFVKIILPQALITALRPLGNEIIFMIKSSAIASIVTILDLMGETKLAFSRSYNFDVYIWAAIMYLIMVEALRVTWDRFERRLTRHLRMPNQDD